MTEPDSAAHGLGTEDFHALVTRQAPALYRFARSLGADPDAAEDLVQHTFLRAFQRRHQYRGGNRGAWLRRILHHLAVDRSRAGSNREIPVETVEQRWAEDSYTVDAATVVERAELRDELEDALVRLPFIYRAAVVLHDVERWTVRDIADAADISLPAAKQRLRRGRMMLVTALAAGAERRTAVKGVSMRCEDGATQRRDTSRMRAAAVVPRSGRVDIVRAHRRGRVRGQRLRPARRRDPTSMSERS
jgi:RNA polymerase sigma-70 factor (ECF subfamily)